MEVGFVGCGIMGEHMCRNIIKGGHQTAVFDPAPEPLERLAADGASVMGSPAEVAAAADVTVIMVATLQQLRDAITGAGGVVEGLRDGAAVVVMSTVSPDLTEEMAAAVTAAGGVLVEAPVVLSQPAAIAGELGIYLGGPEDACARVMPVIDCMGGNIIRMGDVGQAMTMKLCHNILTANIIQAVSEMIVLGRKVGLDIDQMVTAISYGGGQNFFLDSKAASIKGRDFTPRFSIANMHKDVGLAIDFAAVIGANMPAATVTKEALDDAMTDGLAGEDFSAVIKVVEGRSGLDGDS
jgi:3-hydroxyisobutyrate dehydrogenase-like beta-hydroxyacid dehydrogenase